MRIVPPRKPVSAMSATRPSMITLVSSNLEALLRAPGPEDAAEGGEGARQSPLAAPTSNPQQQP